MKISFPRHHTSSRSITPSKPTPASRSEPSVSPRLSYQTIMECGIIWLSALILAVGGLLFTQAMVDTSGYNKDSSVSAVPGADSSSGSDTDSGSSSGSDTSSSPGSDSQNDNTAVRNNRVGDRELPIYCVDTDKKVVALSFDAAWGNEDTKVLMDILAKYDVKVTFFMTGGWVEKYPEDVKYIAAQGHDLGNHSLSHDQMSTLSTADIRKEIQAVHDMVEELTGIEMELFRPPYGDYDNEVITTAADMGYFTVQWDVDSLDWKDYGVDSIIKTVCSHKSLKNGSIILMHNGAKYTPQALESVIKHLLDQGYEIVPISELIIRGSYHLDHSGKQIAD